MDEGTKLIPAKSFLGLPMSTLATLCEPQSSDRVENQSAVSS